MTGLMHGKRGLIMAMAAGCTCFVAPKSRSQSTVWVILLKKSQVHSCCKSAKTPTTSSIDVYYRRRSV